ncbi:O-antigen ligase family protein [Pontibacter ramchanderi]|uniref:O-antigen ligase-like membrane protein n=1 Tax=Pontibacter ramchanderi TaxID=1179743 RepID=A0A2N3U797_9BACT|nr:O-antigen ligase family protein [Pontibacter ramchanderi]PKV62615.1 O-antigen ligase-like membrane protein [Pontibacter ramchanderi]
MGEVTLNRIEPDTTHEEEKLKTWDWGFILTILSVGSVFLGSLLVKIDLSFFQLYPLRFFGFVGVFFILINKGWNDPLLSFNSRFIAVFLLLGLISVVWAPDKILAIKEIGILQTGLTFTWLITRYVNTEDRLNLVISIWIFGAIFVNLIGLWEVLNQQFLLVTEIGSKTERAIERIGFLAPRSIFNNQNNYAFFNAITSIVLLGKIIKKYQPTKLYIINCFSLSLSIFILICSYSRAAIAGFSLCFALFFIFTFLSTSKLKVNLANLAILGVIAFLGLALFEPAILDAITSKLYLVVEKNHQTKEEGRSVLYSTTLNYALENLGIGMGPGSSVHNLNGLPPHSYFLQLLVEYGILIVIGQLYILFRVYKRLSSYHFAVQNAMPMMLRASIIVFPLLSVGPSSIFGEGVFWLWLGLILAYSSVTVREYLKTIDSLQMKLHIHNS